MSDVLVLRNPCMASSSVLEGPWSSPALCFPWIAPCLPAPVPDAFPFLPRSKEGPFACSSAIDPNSHLNLLARPPRWEAGSANEGLPATSPDGLDNYEEGIADTLLLPLIRRFEVSDFLVGERHLTELPTPLYPPTLVCKSPHTIPPTLSRAWCDLMRRHEAVNSQEPIAPQSI